MDFLHDFFSESNESVIWNVKQISSPFKLMNKNQSIHKPIIQI